MSGEQSKTSGGQAAPKRSPKRAVRVGVVTSSVRNKTIRVAVPYTVRHPKYGKTLRRDVTLHVHDERNEARDGDVVEVMQCRPLSKTKCWRLVRIVKRGAGARVGAETAS